MYLYLLKVHKSICPYCRNKFDHLWFLSPIDTKIKEIIIDDIGLLFKDLKNFSIKVTIQNRRIKKILMTAFEPFWKECDKLLSSVGELKEHMYEVHGKPTCSICQGDEILISELKVYNNLKALRKHQSEVINGKILHPLCHFWNRVFESEPDYLKHIKDVHFYCNLCHKGNKKLYIFGSLRSYNNHISKLHWEDIKLKKIDLSCVNKKQLCKNFLFKTEAPKLNIMKFYKDRILAKN